MRRETIDPIERSADVLRELARHGVLLTACDAAGRANPMTIGWGTLGREWETTLLCCFVRASRHTHDLLDEGGEFVVSVPEFGLDPERDRWLRRVLAVCGTRSGRDMDKVADLGLTTVPGRRVGVPAIAELPLTLECRVLYRRDQDVSLLRDDLRSRFYLGRGDDGRDAPDAEPDAHTVYCGEVLDAYVLR